MSHGSSTPNPVEAHSDLASPPPTRRLAKAAPPRSDDDGSTTAWDRFMLNRSDSAFNAFAGAAGGFMSGIVTCPLDVIKTKLQAQGGFRAVAQDLPPQAAIYKGMLGTGRVILKEEGIRGLYRGLGPIILGYLPTWAVWFTVYGKSREYLNSKNYSEFSSNFWSSIIAGSSSTICTNPIWVVKTRLMSQVSATATSNSTRPPWNYDNTLDAFRKMYKTEGFLSFYSGLTPALLGLTHVAVQFPAYEFLKTKFTGRGMGIQSEKSTESQWVGVLSASVLSKIMASSATYPHEVIRTRLQTQQRQVNGNGNGNGNGSRINHSTRGFLNDNGTHSPPASEPSKAPLPRYKGIIITAKTILREEGWRAFYAGMGTNMMRAVPAACTTMLTYEYVMSHLFRMKAEALRRDGRTP